MGISHISQLNGFGWMYLCCNNHKHLTISSPGFLHETGVGHGQQPLPAEQLLGAGGAVAVLQQVLLGLGDEVEAVVEAVGGSQVRGSLPAGVH